MHHIVNMNSILFVSHDDSDEFSSPLRNSGTLDERAARLFSLKGLRRDQYPTKVRGKNFIQ
jgi:hypothetical protein